MSDRFVLLLASVGLFPIALSYGAMPSVSVPMLLGFPVDTTELTHIFRAIMGLYLAMLMFWIAGAFKSALTNAALWSLFLFMAGLAAGRLLSFLVDGLPNFLLVFYFLAEILFAALALLRLRQQGAV
nr:DUF4345 domain-containing protein [uncultured Shimia sp.]